MTVTEQCELTEIRERKDRLQRELYLIQARIEELMGRPSLALLYREWAADRDGAYVRFLAREFLAGKPFPAAANPSDMSAALVEAERMQREEATRNGEELVAKLSRAS